MPVRDLRVVQRRHDFLQQTIRRIQHSVLRRSEACIERSTESLSVSTGLQLESTQRLLDTHK